MNLIRFSGLSRLAATAGLLLGLACTQTHQATAAKSDSHTTTTTAPAVAYQFFTPGSEADLQSQTTYGYLIAKADKSLNERVFSKLGLKVVGRFTVGEKTYYHLQKDADVLTALKALKTVQGILFAEPELAITKDSGITYDNPDPRALSEEYSLAITRCKDAWSAYGFGPHRPVVADIDTGVNFSHEDLANQVIHAYSWYDLDNSGALIDGSADHTVQPIDYIASETYGSTDGNGHGTHTGGTITATGNNGLGVAGVCWNADLISYKGLSDGGSGGTWAIYGSLYHLVNWKTKTAYYPYTIPVNMSLGGSYASQFAADMVEYALENNVVIIASMGNTGQNLAQYPAGYAGVIAVGATNGADKKVHFSTTGPNISVSAPGYNIISTYNTGADAYESESGTSMAAPFVTGLVTYMLTFAPDLRPDQIKTYLEANADYIEGATGYTAATGWGRVNVLNTIAAVVSDRNADTTPSTSYVDYRIEVKVANTVQGVDYPLSGMTVNLYQCDATGTSITNYVASSLSVANSVTNGTSGSAYFNLLKPGYYLATSTLGGNVGSTGVFQVAQGEVIPAKSISFSLPIYNIETFADAGSTGTEDTMISVWNASDELIGSYDVDYLDTLPILLPSGTYTIGIEPYNNRVGDYALWVGPGLYPLASAPGSFVSPDATALLGSQSTVKASPQGISLNQLYNCRMVSSSVDYYSITIP
ncbi:MAG: prtP [Holophagaceae bacterium]|nr:prtP [Holophagaceae bacterium]